MSHIFQRTTSSVGLRAGDGSDEVVGERDDEDLGIHAQIE